jgi:hypothetical protein
MDRSGLITAKWAVLRGEPDAHSRQTRPYLVELDAIAVLEKRPGCSEPSTWVLKAVS